MAMASFIRVLKSSAVIVESTLSMASFSSVLPFITEMPMLISPSSTSKLSSESVKSRIFMSG